MNAQKPGDAGAENPLDVLGVDGTISDNDLRSRYMALVRLHPPERDPEGFRRIRAAYEAVRTRADRARWALRRFKVPPPVFRPGEGLPPGPMGISPGWWLLADPWSDLMQTDFTADCRDLDVLLPAGATGWGGGAGADEPSGAPRCGAASEQPATGQGTGTPVTPGGR